MQLTSALLAEILGPANDDTLTGAPQDERRASRRSALSCRARIFPLMEASAADGQPVLVRDISVHGIGILAAEALNGGDEFVIHLPTVNSSFGHEPLQIQCAVRRCQPGGTGKAHFFVGATFELVLNRPIAYAAVLPTGEAMAAADETSEGGVAAGWDPFRPTAVEALFDLQTAESMSARPPRETIRAQLSEYIIARWLGRLLLTLCLPLLMLGRKLRLLGTDAAALKIRHRLEARQLTKPRKLSELAHIGDAADPAEPARSTGAPPERVPTYAERAALTALDSASHFVPGMEADLPPVVAKPALTGLEKRSSLFAQAPVQGEDIPTSVEAVPFIDETPVPSPAAAVETVAAIAPAAVPTFELPPVLPVATPENFESSSKTVPTSVMQPAAGKSPSSTRSNVAAWRTRHRSFVDQPLRDRPKLGR